MKRLLAYIALGAFALGVMVWFMPARWVAPLLQPHLPGVRLERVEGTVWQGRAGELASAEGANLGELSWNVSRRALLGDLRVGLDLIRPRLQIRGQLHRLSAAALGVHDLTLHMDASLLGAQPWLHGQPQGELDVHVPQARLQGYWPMQLEATGTWSQAAVRTEGEAIPLGTLLFHVSGESGVVQAMFHDDGRGPLQTTGHLSFSPLGWDLRVRLKPRANDRALSAWLQTLGAKPSADGMFQLRYRGGLALLNTAMGKS